MRWFFRDFSEEIGMSVMICFFIGLLICTLLLVAKFGCWLFGANWLS